MFDSEIKTFASTSYWNLWLSFYNSLILTLFFIFKLASHMMLEGNLVSYRFCLNILKLSEKPWTCREGVKTLLYIPANTCLRNGDNVWILFLKTRVLKYFLLWLDRSEKLHSSSLIGLFVLSSYVIGLHSQIIVGCLLLREFTKALSKMCWA